MSAQRGRTSSGASRAAAGRKGADESPASAVAASSAVSARFAPALLDWFDRHGRRDLPWQHPRTPYRVWLSEIMLQQTQVRVVVPYFERFVAALPDVRALAAAPQDTVLGLWSGLGYYARARNLQAAAQRCVDLHGGGLPRDLDALIALPGIGRSTAGAILAQAWGDAHPILDGNVKRVLARVFGVDGWPGTPAVEKRLWAIAETLLPAARLPDYTQAQMDFGATLCTRHAPACAICPLQADCTALREGRVETLPTPRPGKAVPEREAVVLLVRDARGRVLLQKRPPTGVWAALWSLPQAEDAGAAERWFDAHLTGAFHDGEALDPVPHAFSHYRLTLWPRAWRGLALRARVRDNADLRWCAREDWDALGIPAPIRTLLQAMR